MTQLSIIKFKKSPSFSFRGKFNSILFSIIQDHSQLTNLESSPSPNLYNPEKPLKNGVKVAFVKAVRKTFVDRQVEKSPGPGQYESSKLTEKSSLSAKSDGKFQTCSSRFFYKFEDRPGPGAYEVKNDFKKTLPSFSIRKKTKTFHQIQTQQSSFKQDPGAYNIQSTLFRDSSVISIPKQSRIKQQKQSSPGPGRYQINETLFHSQRSFGKRSFSSSARKISFEIKNSSPGPAGYATETSFQMNKRKLKGFSCREKVSNVGQRQVILMPGPGQYDSQPNARFRSTQSCKIPQTERKTLENIFSQAQENPGPGKYEKLNETYSKLNFNSRSAPKFSKAKLEHISSAIKLGTTDKFYEAKITFIKKSSSSFSIGSQKRKSFFDKKLSKLPGPSDYNPQAKLTKQGDLAPKFPKSARQNPILNKLKVGPGQYHNKQMSSSIGKMGIKFSKEKRKTDFVGMQNQNKSALTLLSIISSQNPIMRPIKK